MLADDEADMGANEDAFELLRLIAGRRLSRGRLAVVDATNADAASRRSFLQVAGEHGAPALAIVLDLPERVLLERHGGRAGRSFGPSVVRRQQASIRSGLPSMGSEGFERVWVLGTAEEVEMAIVTRAPRGGQRGPRR
jgi:protein phosphatase